MVRAPEPAGRAARGRRYNLPCPGAPPRSRRYNLLDPGAPPRSRRYNLRVF